jgi:hypothetical protein
MAGTLSLPPQVNGRIHGSLRLAVERISWRVVRPPDSSQVTAVACGVLGCARAPPAPPPDHFPVVCVTASAGWVQVRVKWWGEEGYGSLLRPAACTGLGPALTSSLFYSIRCSRSARVARGVLGFRVQGLGVRV